MNCLKQHAIVWGAAAGYAGATALAASHASGSLAVLVAGAMVGGPVAAYSEKIRRYFANVRYRVGRLQKTGDGGEDCWTVLVKKDWIPFWASPLWHLIRPFLGTEITVDCAGYAPGSVRYNRRPVSVLGKHEPFVVAVGHNDVAAADAGGLLDTLRGIAANAGVLIDGHNMPTIQYEDLTPDQQREMTEQDFYILLGLEILVRDGLQM